MITPAKFGTYTMYNNRVIKQNILFKKHTIFTTIYNVRTTLRINYIYFPLDREAKVHKRGVPNDDYSTV